MRETNYKDSTVGSPLDFIAFHLKGTDFAINKIGNFTSEKLASGISEFSPSLDYIKRAQQPIWRESLLSREQLAFRFILPKGI